MLSLAISDIGEGEAEGIRRTTTTANMVRDSSIQCTGRSMMLSTSFKCSPMRVPRRRAG